MLPLSTLFLFAPLNPFRWFSSQPCSLSTVHVCTGQYLAQRSLFRFNLICPLQNSDLQTQLALAFLDSHLHCFSSGWIARLSPGSYSVVPQPVNYSNWGAHSVFCLSRGPYLGLSYVAYLQIIISHVWSIVCCCFRQIVKSGRLLFQLDRKWTSLLNLLICISSACCPPEFETCVTVSLLHISAFFPKINNVLLLNFMVLVFPDLSVVPLLRSFSK